MCNRKCLPILSRNNPNFPLKLSPPLMSQSQTNRKWEVLALTKVKWIITCHLPLHHQVTPKCSPSKLLKTNPALPKTTCHLLPLQTEEHSHSIINKTKRRLIRTLAIVNTKHHITTKRQQRATFLLPLLHLLTRVPIKPWTLHTKITTQMLPWEDKSPLHPRIIPWAGLHSHLIINPGPRLHLHLIKRKQHKSNTKSNIKQAIPQILKRMCHHLLHHLRFTKTKLCNPPRQAGNQPKISPCHHPLAAMCQLETLQHSNNNMKMRMMKNNNSINPHNIITKGKGHHPHKLWPKCSRLLRRLTLYHPLHLRRASAE